MTSTYLHSSSGHHVFRDVDVPSRVMIRDRMKRWSVWSTDGRTFFDADESGFNRKPMHRPPAGAIKAMKEWLACEHEAGRTPFS